MDPNVKYFEVEISELEDNEMRVTFQPMAAEALLI